MRTIASTYYGKAPDGEDKPRDGWFTNWVKCATCARVTLHAEIADVRPPVDGCWGERDNLEQTKALRELRTVLKDCNAAAVDIEWVEDLPGWEKRTTGDSNRQEVIVAEVDRRNLTHHVRLVVGIQATKKVGALRRILEWVTADRLQEETIYGSCGCGWDMYVCSYCPGEDWRWNGTLS